MQVQHDDQPLLVSMDSFWASESNKMQLQQYFITWLTKNYSDDKYVYLGGCLPGDFTGCVIISSGLSRPVTLLKCNHEEADDRLMFHINHGIKVDRYQKVIIASADTDVFVSSLFHFTRWTHSDLNELWMLCGQGLTSRAVPLHDIAERIHS